MNIARSLDDRALKAPDQPALISPSGTLSYGELGRRSGFSARALSHWGVKEGMRVIIMVRPGPDFLITTFALLKLGAVLVLVDPGMGRGNLARCLAEARPEAFAGIWKAQAARYLLGWCKETIKLCLTTGPVAFPGTISLKKLLRRFQPPSGPHSPVETEDDTPAAIAFTSGSTGVPKGVVFTHGMFAAQARLLGNTYRIKEYEVDLATFPLFALFDPALGMTTVFPEMDFSRPGSVDPGKIVDCVRKNRVTHMFGSPALLDRVGGFYATAEEGQMPSVKRVLSAGAPVQTSTLDRFSKILSRDAQIYTPYGATEALPVCSISARERKTLGGTSEGKGVCVGRPLQGVNLSVISISDAPIENWSDQLSISEGEIGEIVVWGANVSREYFHRQEDNRLAKIQDPEGNVRHRMGDLGYLDSEGRLWFCGRKAHRVTTPEGTLYSVCCEGIFNDHEAVRRSALVGIGLAPAQEAVLCVELWNRDKWKGSKELRNELLDLAGRHEMTRPIRKILFHRSFPVDIRHNAKIFREELAEWAEKQLR